MANVREWDPRSPNIRALGATVDESDNLTWDFSTGVDASTTWNFGDEATATTAHGTASHTYAAAGDYTVTAVAIGLEATATITVTQNLTVLGAVVDGVNSLIWHFDTSVAASTDWDFGDEATETTVGATVSHTYAAAGDYTVVATGATIIATAEITVVGS